MIMGSSSGGGGSGTRPRVDQLLDNLPVERVIAIDERSLAENYETHGQPAIVEEDEEEEDSEEAEEEMEEEEMEEDDIKNDEESGGVEEDQTQILRHTDPDNGNIPLYTTSGLMLMRSTRFSIQNQAGYVILATGNQVGDVTIDDHGLDAYNDDASDDLQVNGTETNGTTENDDDLISGDGLETSDENQDVDGEDQEVISDDEDGIENAATETNDQEILLTEFDTEQIRDTVDADFVPLSRQNAIMHPIFNHHRLRYIKHRIIAARMNPPGSLRADRVTQMLHTYPIPQSNQLLQLFDARTGTTSQTQKQEQVDEEYKSDILRLAKPATNRFEDRLKDFQTIWSSRYSAQVADHIDAL